MRTKTVFYFFIFVGHVCFWFCER